MKKISLILVSFLFILIGCSPLRSSTDLGNISNITLPEQYPGISGIWKKTEEHEINKPVQKNFEEESQVFLSQSVVHFEDSYTLNPTITSRLVNTSNYLTNKMPNIPETLLINQDTAVIYKFTNSLSFSREFIQLSDNKLITISLGKIQVFEKEKDLSSREEDEKYSEVQSLIRGEENNVRNDFGLAISFRKRNQEVKDQIYYDYFTYFIKRNGEDENPEIIKVKDVVIPKTSGLWSVKSEKIENPDGTTTFELSSNSTFAPENEKTNKIYGNIYKRIDYVNRNFIGLTNFDNTVDSLSQSYSIHNLTNLNSEKLNVTDIAGNLGNEVFQTAYVETANQMLNRVEIEVIESTPEQNNIGLERTSNRWNFVSSIDQRGTKNSGRIFKKYNVELTPVINIANSDTPTITWREIIARRPGAVDAILSPDKTFILIQTGSSIEMYPVFHNYIGNRALFNIQNVGNYELVMSQWVSTENINRIYEEFDKLDKLNNYIIFP